MSRRKSSERYAAIRQSFWRHPETVGLSLAAKGLFACGLSYVADCLTDGFIPVAVASTLLAQGDADSVNELVSAGQWEAVEGGYQVAKYLDHNRSKAQLDAVITARKKAGKAGGKSKAKGVASATAKAKQTRSKTLVDIDIDIDTPQAPQGAAEEVESNVSPRDKLKASVRALTEKGPTTPEAAWRLVSELSDLYPILDPGMPSPANLARLRAILGRAETLASQHGGGTAMAVVAFEWRAMQRLARAGECSPKAPLIYFHSRFGSFAEEADEKQAGAA